MGSVEWLGAMEWIQFFPDREWWGRVLVNMVMNLRVLGTV
jgi:hypothetical protein